MQHLLELKVIHLKVNTMKKTKLKIYSENIVSLFLTLFLLKFLKSRLQSPLMKVIPICQMSNKAGNFNKLRCASVFFLRQHEKDKQRHTIKNYDDITLLLQVAFFNFPSSPKSSLHYHHADSHHTSRCMPLKTRLFRVVNGTIS